MEKKKNVRQRRRREEKKLYVIIMDCLPGNFEDPWSGTWCSKLNVEAGALRYTYKLKELQRDFFFLVWGNKMRVYSPN